jgi:hypothetical protein
MTMIDVDVAGDATADTQKSAATDFVDTVARAARSDTKAVIAYLVASNATAVSVIENTSGFTFRVGTKLDPRAASVHWLPEDKARPVMKAARRIAGARPDIETATAALHQAAAGLKVTVSDHRAAIERAGAMAARLDAFIAQLRARGALRDFQKIYRRLRLAATARGEGFMPFSAAEIRLRKTLIKLLQGGGNVHTATIFADVFAVSQTGQHK